MQPAQPIGPSEREEIDEVLDQFGIPPATVVEAVPRGALNLNYRATTPAGSFFVRKHREALTADRVRQEHRLVAWLLERGLPVALPLAAPGEISVLTRASGLWAVTPWVEGRPIDRHTMTRAEASAVGDMHGRMHRALAGHPLSEGAPFTLQWDKEQSLETLDRVAEVARAAGAEGWIQDGIAAQARRLADEQIHPPASFAALPCQLVHGDYHDQQVLLDQSGQVALVADWEMFQPFPRVWELVRSLGFARILGDDRLETYLGAYARHVQLSEDECRLAVQLWWQSRLGGTWIWTARFIEGNARVGQFFPATIEGLVQLSEPGFREQLAERFVRAATGA